MNNNRFYGYKQKKDELTLPNGNINVAFERVNPYEFKKGMDYELTKKGFGSLREAPEDEREKATTKVMSELNKNPYHYSCLIAYETETRGMEKKPSFASFKKTFEEARMKEIKIEKLKESIKNKVRTILKENPDPINLYQVLDAVEKEKTEGKNSQGNFASTLEKIAQQVWAESNLDAAKKILIDFVQDSKINDESKNKIISTAKSQPTKRKLDFYVANSLLNFEKLGVREETKENKIKTKNKKMSRLSKDDLKEMIATELADFFKEEDDISVDVGDSDGFGGEGEDEESVELLRQIYDMLKGKFEDEEGGEDLDMNTDLDDMDSEAGEEESEEEEEEEEVEETRVLQERFEKLANIKKSNLKG